MARLIPESHRELFHWQIAKMVRKEWASICERVPAKVEDCLLHPQIRPIILVVGPERVKEFIEARLIWLTAQLNVAHPMNIAQIKFAAETLLERYPNESIADFVLCFRRGAQGFYGSSYHQLDASVIMSWMAQHMEEKAYYLERQASEEKKEEITIDYEAFKIRLEQERVKQREDRIQEIVREDQQASHPTRPKYTPPPAEYVARRTLHVQYLSAKWKHDRDPANLDADCIKILNPFISEDEWTELQTKPLTTQS